MTRDPGKLAGSFENENTGGLLSGLLADEDVFDRRARWRLGWWASASVCAVIVALVASQSSIGIRHEQIAEADLARQSQQIQSIAKESQSEARRLASAIETLNGDRDRLYSRVTVLEQGLDSVTGALARQKLVAASPPAAAPAPAEAPVVAQKPATPVVSPVATATPAMVTSAVEKPAAAVPAPEPTPVAASAPAAGSTGMSNASAPPAPAAPPAATTSATSPAAATPATAAPLMASKSIMAPPDPAARKLIEPSSPPKSIEAAPLPDVVASAPPAADEEPEASETVPKLAVQRTEFGVDVGTANSLSGLRALWRGLLKSRSNAPLAALRPIIVVKESTTGLGMQLRLVAGPLNDAAAAAKICATMIENDRSCETTVFDGQRLAVNGDDTATSTITKPAAHKHSSPKHAAAKDEPKKPAPAPPTSTLSQFFSGR